MIAPPSAPPNWPQRVGGINLPVTGSGLAWANGSRAKVASESRADLPELGIVAGRGHFRLGDRIQGRHDQRVSVEKIAIVGAIKDRIYTDDHLTVYLDGKAALRIFCGSVAPTKLGRSRSNQQQFRKVPAKLGQLINFFCADNSDH